MPSLSEELETKKTTWIALGFSDNLTITYKQQICHEPQNPIALPLDPSNWGAVQGPTLNYPAGAWDHPEPTGPWGWGNPSLDKNPHGPQYWFPGCSLGPLQPSTTKHGVDQIA